jgi:hypothetical protein
MTLVFLTFEEVFAIHADQVERYGGDSARRHQLAIYLRERELPLKTVA